MADQPSFRGKGTSVLAVGLFALAMAECVTAITATLAAGLRSAPPSAPSS